MTMNTRTDEACISHKPKPRLGTRINVNVALSRWVVTLNKKKMCERVGTLEFRSNSGDERGETLAKTLMNVNIRRRNTKHELKNEGQRRLNIATKHRASRVSYQRQGM